ncbi:molybdopterin/thiamine biosynthesis adenylyltransferase [Paraburkholderia atlantica]|uniref:HesA/MoeB/ThiF family protein n=1 Tax=Paraburkholderia atlantica TaxID=2654982 RepID=UPI003D1F786A
MKLDRYQRHSLIDWFSQESLKAARYAVVGCGAVGNEVAKNLALLGVGSIHLYDFDTIELHNLTRSVLFRESDVGANKAVVAARRILELDPAVEVAAFPGDFWDCMRLADLMQYAAIFCCVDNFEARIKLNQLCRFAGINLVNAGIDSRNAMVELFPFAQHTEAACYECNLPLSSYQRIQERYSCGWLKRIAHVERKVPTTIITSSLAGAHAVSAGLRLGTGEEPSRSAHRIYVDSVSGRTTISALSKNDACALCSGIGSDLVIAQASATVTNELSTVAGGASETILYASDPVVTTAYCTRCAENPDDSAVVFKRASDFDAGLRWCSKCSEDSVNVDITDTFTIAELVGSYLGKRIPAKFVRFRQDEKTYVIELES